MCLDLTLREHYSSVTPRRVGPGQSGLFLGSWACCVSGVWSFESAPIIPFVGVIYVGCWLLLKPSRVYCIPALAGLLACTLTMLFAHFFEVLFECGVSVFEVWGLCCGCDCA